MIATLRMIQSIDVRADLGEVRVPTLILHRKDDRVNPVRASAYLARKIPGARMIVHEGEDHIPMVGDAQALLDDICGFITTLMAG